MQRPRNNRFAGLLLAVLGAAAMLALPGIAAAKDRNHDGIPDRWEKKHHLSLKVNQATRDQDRDSLDNRGEFKAGDNPRDRDSDNDGVIDGDENAGTIASYDSETDKLTITLFGGETVTGVVTEDTRIRCGHECHHGDEQEPGDDSGEASASDRGPGDRSGPPGQGDDQNDDPPGHDGTPPGASEGPGNGAENTANCGPEALVVGATVSEAELELAHGVATFEKIDLAK
jgi:hypothetical protein